MSDKISLTAELRADVGKGASRRLRRMGEQVPAIIYGAKETPQTLSLSVNELSKVMQQESFYSQIMNVVIEGKEIQAVVRDLQRNPASGNVTHIDFQRISADQVMHVSVPLHFINEEDCVGVRMGGGSIMHNLTEVEISCLPADLPQFIEVDMETLDIGSSVHLSGLALPGGVTIVALSYGENRDIPVVSVVLPRGGLDEELEGELLDEAEAGDEDADTDADAEGESSDAGDDKE
jgi:large subunit ribosomal protein L25